MEQLRPNIHIRLQFVELLIKTDNEKINNQIYNVGSENMSVMEIAKIVKKNVENYLNLKDEILIEIETSNDNRSYHINSDKAFEQLGFKTKLSINDAVFDICDAFSKNEIPDPIESLEYYNVKKIKSLNI